MLTSNKLTIAQIGLTTLMMLGGLWLYMSSSTTQSAVLVHDVETLRNDLDKLEESLSSVPTTLARIEERIKYLQGDIEHLKEREE